MESFNSLILPLDTIPNARELGGYVMKDGRKIKQGLLLRSGSLSNASDLDLTILKEKYNVIHVFDYRTSMESQHSPDRLIEGADLIPLPCIDPDQDIYEGTEFVRKAGRPGFFDFIVDYSFTDEAKDIARKMYPALVMSEYTQLQYGTFLNFASRNENGALLWHCSQGKDRTGLATAFLLYVLGASRELIIDDFDFSNVCYKDLMSVLKSKVIALGGSDKELDVIDSLVGVNTRRFVSVLDLIDKEFGSMDNYIHNQLCITDQDIINIRNRFLE